MRPGPLLHLLRTSLCGLTLSLMLLVPSAQAEPSPVNLDGYDEVEEKTSPGSPSSSAPAAPSPGAEGQEARTPPLEASQAETAPAPPEPWYEWLVRMLAGLLVGVPAHWRLDVLAQILWMGVELFVALAALAGLGLWRGRIHDYDVTTFRGRDPRRWVIAGAQVVAEWALAWKSGQPEADAGALEEMIKLRRELAALRQRLRTWQAAMDLRLDDLAGDVGALEARPQVSLSPEVTADLQAIAAALANR